MSAATEEKWADWCESDEDAGFAICGTRVVEHSRRSLGVKWCFTCRNRHEFSWVVMAPDGMSYYGPHIEIKGVRDGCRDLFPGWTREWDED